MHRYEISVLGALRKQKRALGIDELISASGLGKDNVMWALENLKAQGLVEFEVTERERARLTDEGRGYAERGLPEERLVEQLKEKGAIKLADLDEESRQIGLSWAKRNGLVEIKDGLVLPTGNAIKAISEGIGESSALKKLLGNPDASAIDSRVLENLSRRKLVIVESRKELGGIRLTKQGGAAKTSLEKEGIDSLDKNMITTGRWKGRSFKPYDVNVGVERRIAARRHPLRNVINSLREAYISMGFREISSPAVDSSFWVFDSLFMPQDHPAREMQDTFYLENPEIIDIDEVPYVGHVRKAHEKGWHQEWSINEARRAVLRTHMTSASARYIYKAIADIARENENAELPIKRFALGRVFRNENIDYKHLADLNQADGIIMGKDLTLANLFDVLIKLYAYLGIKIRFKPSYFPFVEPGIEYYAYSENAKEWIELGGGGIIREEITGISRNKVSVLAWGAGVERNLLIKDPSLKSISELYNGGVGWLRQRKML